MNLKCVVVSVLVAFGIGGTYCAETKAVGYEVKNQMICSGELIGGRLEYDIDPTDMPIKPSITVSSIKEVEYEKIFNTDYFTVNALRTGVAGGRL